MDENAQRAIAYLNLVLADHHTALYREDVVVINNALTILNRLNK